MADNVGLAPSAHFSPTARRSPVRYSLADASALLRTALQRRDYAMPPLTAGEAISTIAPLADSLACVLARLAAEPGAGAQLQFCADLADYLRQSANSALPRGEVES